MTKNTTKIKQNSGNSIVKKRNCERRKTKLEFHFDIRS